MGKTFSCDYCEMAFPSRERRDRHRKVHLRKPRYYEYGDVNIPQSVAQYGQMIPFFAWLFGRFEEDK